MDISNVQLFCYTWNKFVRVSQKIIKDKKVRYCKKCDKNI
jgi:ribosomal protein L24